MGLKQRRLKGRLRFSGGERIWSTIVPAARLSADLQGQGHRGVGESGIPRPTIRKLCRDSVDFGKWRARWVGAWRHVETVNSVSGRVHGRKWSWVADENDRETAWFFVALANDRSEEERRRPVSYDLRHFVDSLEHPSSIDTPLLFRLSRIFSTTILSKVAPRVRSIGRSFLSPVPLRCNDLWWPVDTSLVIPWMDRWLMEALQVPWQLTMRLVSRRGRLKLIPRIISPFTLLLSYSSHLT